MGKERLRVVLDTNVILSSLLFGGRLAFVHKAWREGKLTLLFSEGTLEELAKTLHYPKFRLEEKEIDYLLYIEVLPYSEMIKISSKVDKNVCRDVDDIKFLECGLSGKADFIVSGDKALLSIGEIGGIRIIPPSELKKLIE